MFGSEEAWAVSAGLMDPRNRLLPRFINKATTAEPIQDGEKILLQSRSKINKRKHRKPKLATENKKTRPSIIGAPQRSPLKG
jgi:hypothetical protein